MLELPLVLIFGGAVDHLVDADDDGGEDEGDVESEHEKNDGGGLRHLVGEGSKKAE